MAAVEIAEHTTRWRLCKVEGDGRAEQRNEDARPRVFRSSRRIHDHSAHLV